MVSTVLLVIIYVSFISLGLPDSVLGSVWPTMSAELGAPLWGAGFIQMTVALCTVVASLNSARLIRQFGTGKLTAYSVVLTAAALLGFSAAKHYVWLVLIAIPLGLGAGAVDSALNNYVALHCQARHMSWLHCFWGLGTIIGPVIISYFLSRGVSWRSGYLAIGILQAAFCAVLFAKLSLWKKEGLQEEERSAKALSVRQVLALPGAKAGMVTFLCYCAVEHTMILWAPTYMVAVRGIDAVQAARFGSLFCIGITVGRALSGFMAARFSPKQLVHIGEIVMLAGCLMLFAPVNALMLAGVVICGLGCAPIYPNIIQDTPVNYGAENSQAAIGVQMAFAYIGSTFAPTVFGVMARACGYGILPVFALTVTAAMVLLYSAQQSAVRAKNMK